MIDLEIRLPKSTVEYLDTLAAIAGVSPNTIANVLLAQYILRNERVRIEETASSKEESPLASLDSKGSEEGRVEEGREDSNAT